MMCRYAYKISISRSVQRCMSSQDVLESTKEDAEVPVILYPKCLENNERYNKHNIIIVIVHMMIHLLIASLKFVDILKRTLTTFLLSGSCELTFSLDV